MVNLTFYVNALKGIYMRTRSKLLIAAISAIALLGVAVSAASAARLEVPNSERGFRIVWTHLHLEAAGREADCPVTLEGSFERRTYAKNAEEFNQVGRVTAAAVGTCARNHATVLTSTLPWEVNYSSFEGPLPNITGVTLALIRASFQVELEGVTCLARTTTSRPAKGIGRLTGNSVTGFEAERNASIETTGGFFCSLSGGGHFSGAASSVTVRGGAEAISIRLI